MATSGSGGVALSQTFTSENHANSVLQNLYEQRSSIRFCDVILRVGKNEVYAHSNVLAAASPYFGTFLGHGQDHPRAFSQKTPQIIEIHIDGNGDNAGYADAVSLIVSYMYSSRIELTSKFLLQVIEIAKIMQMNKVLEFCKQFESGEVESFTPDTQNKVCTNDVAIQTVHSIPYFPTELDDIDEMDDVKHGDLEGQKLSPQENNFSYSSDTDITDVNVRSVILKEHILNAESVKREKENELIQNTSSPDNKNKNPVAKRRRGRPPKVPQRKTSKNEEMHEASIQTDPVSDTSDDDDIPDFDNSVPNTNEKSDQSSINKGKLPVRKNRGKRPSKFIDDAQSDSDALVVDEHDQTEQPSPFKREMLLTCDECPYTTYVEYHFNRHVQAHNNEQKRTYQCNQCDFKAPRMKALHAHIRDHMHEKNICSFCDMDFENKESLVEHLQTHEPPNPYYCNYCGAKYRTRAQLNVHLPKHLNAKPFVCGICQAGFKWKHALKCHMATHSTTKEHLCDVCGFSTAHKSQLKAHKLIHTGDTFKCEYPNCKFQSIKKQSLKYHMLTHTQEKPHQCEICGQSFSLTKNLKRHSLLHTDHRPYKCSFNDNCNFATTRFDKLKEHKLKIHGSGEAPGKKFRLSDYPKSLVPPDDPEILEATDRVQNIIHIGNSNLNINQVNDVETKVYIQQPGGEPIPVTLVASKFEIPYQIGQFISKLEN